MQGWINLFESLYDNTTLNCSDAHLTELKPNNDVAKSVCEMLKRNQGLQNLNISDVLNEGNLKEFAMAYIQRKSVLNLTVGKLEEQLVNEIEELEIKSTILLLILSHHCYRVELTLYELIYCKVLSDMSTLL